MDFHVSPLRARAVEVAILVGFFLGFPPAASASSTALFPRVSPSFTSQNNGFFGSAVAFNSRFTLVDAVGETVGGQLFAGIVYVYNTTSGALLTTLESPSPQGNGWFGLSISLVGKYAVIGAPGESSGGQDQAGNAYVFNVVSGALIAAMTSPNPQLSGYFGWSVSLSGKSALIGTIGETSGGQQDAGIAYIFNITSGALLETITTPSPAVGGWFGRSVSLVGGSALIGAPGENSSEQVHAGNTYLFNITSGALLATLTSPNPEAYGFFGVSVFMNGRYAIVGAPYETSRGQSQAGNAYIFNMTSGALLTTLISPNLQAQGIFGTSVFLNGKFAVIGAPGEIAGGQTSAGNAYQFNAASGVLIATLTSPNPQASGSFGGSVSIVGRYVISGAPGETAGGQSGAGNAYLFRSGKLVLTLSD